MGRPSRKTIASILKFEDPDGEILFFEIDKKGNSRMIINKNNYQSFFQTQKTIQDNLYNLQVDDQIVSSDQITDDEIKINKTEKTTENAEKGKQKTDSNQVEKFNLFLEEIENHMNMDIFYREFRLSDKMLIPISAC